MGLLNKLIGNASAVSTDKLTEKYARLLLEDEVVELGFKLIRDTYIFTNRRLILIDIQVHPCSYKLPIVPSKEMEYKMLQRELEKDRLNLQ